MRPSEQGGELDWWNRFKGEILSQHIWQRTMEEYTCYQPLTSTCSHITPSHIHMQIYMHIYVIYISNLDTQTAETKVIVSQAK